MSERDHVREIMVDYFRILYKRAQGGIFTQKTRERILTNKGISGRGRTKSQFWYRHRENVKTALIDLQLFAEFSGKDNVNAVLTKESLESIIGALLTHVGVFSDPPDPEKAKIADMLIRQGFTYLEGKAGSNITLSHQRTIKEAIDLSGYLLQTIMGEPYHRPEKNPYNNFG